MQQPGSIAAPNVLVALSGKLLHSELDIDTTGIVATHARVPAIALVKRWSSKLPFESLERAAYLLRQGLSRLRWHAAPAG